MNKVPQYRRKSAWRTQRGRRKSCIEPLEERALLTSIIDLGTLPDGIESVPTGINDSGQVVGYSLTGANVHSAFLYSDGLMSNLGVLPGDIDSRARESTPPARSSATRLPPATSSTPSSMTAR